MISVGNRQVIFHETLLCPVGEDIDLIVSVPGETDPWPVRIIFSEVAVTIDKAKEKIDPYMRADDEDGISVINFVNWTNRSGHFFPEPVKIGSNNNGHPISLLVHIAKLSSTLYRAYIQIMITEDKDV